MSDSKTYLVTGASGFLGRLVLDALLERGAERIIATTRTPETLAEYARKGVEVRAADFSQPEGLDDAFRGATHLLMISTHGVGSRSETHGAAINAAKRVGVQHLFYTSHVAPDTSTSPVAPEHAITERLIKESGLTYTMLRNFLYSENLMLVVPQALETGRFYGAANDGKVSWLPRKDCADAAAGAMLNPGPHANKTYDVTGPKAYSYADVAALLSEITGRTITYENLSPEAYRAHLIKQGLPEPAADIYLGLDMSLQSDEMAPVTDAVRVLAGHEPGRLEDFLSSGLSTAEQPATLDFLKGKADH
jgi:NAD(P)H dehydrogenase (quinone)